MAFIKKDWKCGDTITADDLNRLENGVEEALEGGSVDCGYSCTEGWVTLTDESVTTALGEGFAPVAQLTYSAPLDADTIKVTFNGTEYICNLGTSGGYGAPWNEATQSVDWSEYPFALAYLGSSNAIMTETAGTYQVKIEVFGDVTETSECFDKARGYSCSESTTLITNETISSTDF